jgi:hypothetical protein
MNPFKFNKRGQAMVEFAFMVPVMVTIIFGVIELSNFLTFSLRASNISREIANAAFRDCGFLSTGSMSTCLQSSADRVREHADFIFNDFTNLGAVVVSTYEANPPDLAGQETAGAGGYTSRYDIGSVDQDVLATHERIVIGEVFYPYVPITPAGSLLNLFNISPVVYEVTIY